MILVDVVTKMDLQIISSEDEIRKVKLNKVNNLIEFNEAISMNGKIMESQTTVKEKNDPTVFVEEVKLNLKPSIMDQSDK